MFLTTKKTLTISRLFEENMGMKLRGHRRILRILRGLMSTRQSGDFDDGPRKVLMLP